MAIFKKRKFGITIVKTTSAVAIYFYFYLNVTSLKAAVQRLEYCINDTKHWVTYNYLQMNDAKTDILPVLPVSAPALVAGLHVRVGYEDVRAGFSHN